MKRLVTLLSFLCISFPLFYIDGTNANQSSEVYFTPDEIRNEIRQISSYNIQAPEFPEHLDWFNTKERIELSDLKGQIVIINFWTFGSTKAMEQHKQLKAIKAKYRDQVKFIDVQSPNFYNNLDRNNIQDAIKKYKIDTPVVFDRDNRIRQAFNVHHYPTFVILNKQGQYAGYLSGLDKIRLLETYINSILSL